MSTGDFVLSHTDSFVQPNGYCLCADHQEH